MPPVSSLMPAAATVLALLVVTSAVGKVFRVTTAVVVITFPLCRRCFTLCGPPAICSVRRQL